MRGHLSYNALAAGLFSVMKALFSPGGCCQLVGTTVYGGVIYIFRRRLAALKTSFMVTAEKTETESSGGFNL